MKKWVACAAASTLVLSTFSVDTAHAKKLILRAVTKQDTTMYKYKGKEAITTIPATEVILIRQRDKQWTKIEYNNEYGYVLSAHLKFSKTSKQKEEELAETGEALRKTANTFHHVVDKGNMERIIVESLKLDFAIAQYNAKIISVNPGKAAKERLTVKYLNPARREIKRLKYEMKAWENFKLAETYIQDMQYDKAKKTYNKAVRQLKSGKNWRKKMRYDDLPKKVYTKLDQRSKKINKRFTYSTFTDLVNEGHVQFLADFQFGLLSSEQPFVDSNGTTHTNGFMTKGHPLVQSSVLIHLRNELDEAYGRDVPIFKKVRYTVARSKASNTTPLADNVSVVLRGKYDLYDTTTIEPTNEPIEKQMTITKEPTIFFDFREVPANMAIVNIKFYR